MPTEETYWQFKDAELTREDIHKMLGATLRRRKPGTVLRFWCRRAKSTAKQLAAEENAHGDVRIIIEELGP